MVLSQVLLSRRWYLQANQSTTTDLTTTRTTATTMVADTTRESITMVLIVTQVVTTMPMVTDTTMATDTRQYQEDTDTTQVHRTTIDIASIVDNRSDKAHIQHKGIE